MKNSVLSLEGALDQKLRQLDVRVDSPDGNTCILRNVPVDRRFFSKPRTNLLFKRPRAGALFLIAVDEDLAYTGDDPALARAFAAASLQQGWRVLGLRSEAQRDLGGAVRGVLALLGQPGQELPAGGGLLSTFGLNLSAQVRAGKAPATIGRREQIERAVACLLAWERRMPLLVAEPGVGKTNFLSGLAGRLEQARPGLDFIAVNAGTLSAGTLLDSERENLLGALLKEAHRGGVVLCLEHLEYAMVGSPHASAMLGDALDRGAMLAGTTLPERQSRIESYPLARRIEVLTLEEPGAGDTLLALRAAAGAIAAHHGVAVGDELLQAVVDRSIPLAGRLPAKAIALLDSAACRASLNRAPALTLIDIYLAASCLPEG